MPDSLLFIGVARQLGYSEAAAQTALAAVRAQLGAAGVAANRFFIYRTGDGGVGVGEGAQSEAAQRPRVLVAFQSADTALAFAQGAGLGRSPRLVGLTLSQILAALIQRPAIGTLLIASEDDLPARTPVLPPGARLERAELIALLAEVAS